VIAGSTMLYSWYEKPMMNLRERKISLKRI
jgi:hypothetical protein